MSSVSPQKKFYYPTKYVSDYAYISSMEQYDELHKQSIEQPEIFWEKFVKDFFWKEPADPKNFLSFNFDATKGPIFIKWMEGAKTNISFNLLDRNVLSGHGDKVAFYWEGNHPDDHSRLTYRKLLEEVCRVANVLKGLGVKKGDRVAIYMPMILELPTVMLACARIGAIHTIVFAGFSAECLAERMVCCQAKILITADGGWRGGKFLNIKSICDDALEKAETHGHRVEKCIIIAHKKRATPGNEELAEESENPIYFQEDRDLWYHEETEDAEIYCEPEWMDAEDPLFILYTSGSTGKPKGVLHTTAGYLLYASTTFKLVFDYKPNDIYWCTADIGWITGHTYGVYGPLANAASTVMFEGTPFYPDNDRFWVIVDKYKVTQFYTAPTAIRTLMKFSDEPVTRHDLSSLRVLGSVGEPINPEAWYWYYKLVGKEKCSIVDTFWQTETGGHVITPLPGATPMKPGSASKPFFGVQPILLDESGEVIEGEGEGYLVFNRPWPGMARSLYDNHARFEEAYFSKFDGYYCTGDGARRDADGYIWVTGRIDDMLNVSGHLMSTAEVESVLTEHPNVAESAVVGRPHPIKGECLHCFITPNDGVEFTEQMIVDLKKIVREKIGPVAVPDMFQYAPGLPKTRSGKIMRRVLRKVAINDRDVGDTSTLADEGVVQQLFANRPKN